MPVASKLRVAERDEFAREVERSTGDPLRAVGIQSVQVNIGLKCNLACRHCHVESSPKRTEEMDWATMELVLGAARQVGARTLDITGGAPEMHPHFRRFVAAATESGLAVIVRTNLTIMLEDDYRDLPEFFRRHRVQLVASLPCYLEENVDRQRGPRVYNNSVEVLRALNPVGYGVDPELCLDLVYNPVGPALPPPQADLEAAYRKELASRFGIRFTKLVAMTNMPIGRFLADLQRQGKGQDYERLLRESFNPETVPGLMCRHHVHVGHDGRLYDCDFNYALGLGVADEAGPHIRDFDPESLPGRCIRTGPHCYGCTAGAGSSCAGALT
jgi:radical SAM/Cys-rich protein